ncbi:3'-5' exonuclease [Algoriphagus hitonicola]|uniref:DNA polymerase-3 subunit epsilon n=1 Tax=Algoriphagus hitonicola TaxID=435880 RepID=A0A1I2QQF0_9BACT|nr:3'-5' exonuclease [Algoriphagus hitonicola]SFG27841.1 DNA polymerase-3 subunit epsilon [Algoriphagus hitonicola]
MSWWPFQKKNRVRKRDFILDFLQKASKPIPGTRAISRLEFVVLDTETSGFNFNKDQVLSFGAVKIKADSICVASSVEWYPKVEIKGEKAATIHGLVQTQNQLEPEDFLQKLLAYFGDGILVGHHVGFDLEMLLRIGREFGLEAFPNAVIDTKFLALRLEHGPRADFNQIKPEEYSLDQVCIRFGISLDDRHTAAGDAFLTAQLLIKLLALAKRKGILTYQDLMR